MSLVPFDDRDGQIWFDGKLIPWRDAKLHVLSHALHYAAAAFEGERAYGGVVFKSREHSERLRADGRRGAAGQDPPRDRVLGLAVLFLARAAGEGHPPQMGRL